MGDSRECTRARLPHLREAPVSLDDADDENDDCRPASGIGRLFEAEGGACAGASSLWPFEEEFEPAARWKSLDVFLARRLPRPSRFSTRGAACTLSIESVSMERERVLASRPMDASGSTRPLCVPPSRSHSSSSSSGPDTIGEGVERPR